MTHTEEPKVLPWHIEVTGAGFVRCNGIYEWVDSVCDIHDGWYEKLGDSGVFLVLNPLHGPRLSSQSPVIYAACPRTNPNSKSLHISFTADGKSTMVDRLQMYRSSDG